MPSATTYGFHRIPNAAAGIEALGLYTKDPAQRSPYVFGLGVDDTGRISTGTRAGTTLEFPDAYGFGEAIELRFRTADTGNGQFQGVYLQVRSDVANSGAIRAMELEARQGAAVAIGSLTPLHAKANIASTTTGTITTARGGEVGVAFNSSAYTGTVTNLYGLHIKNQIEDGATITTGYGLYIETEDVSGASSSTARLDAVIGVASTSGGVFRYGIDSTASEFTNGSGNEVVLWAFKGANGTTYYLIHDTDAATAVSVVTTDPTT